MKLLLIIAFGVVLALNLQSGKGLAHSGDSFVATMGSPTVDGVNPPGEWTSATSISVFPGLRGSMLYTQYDGTNIYFLLAVQGDADLSPDDRVNIRFDNDHNGRLDQGDDEVFLSGSSEFRDTHYEPPPPGVVDCCYNTDDVEVDGFGEARRSGNTNFFELSHPLWSSNEDDIDLRLNGTLSFCVRYFRDGTSTSGQTSFPAGCELTRNTQLEYAHLDQLLIDTDDDGIADAAELFPLRDDVGNVVADMPALGGDPCRKTVAVESDYMHGAPDHSHRPPPEVISTLVEKFNSAPTASVAACPYAGYPRFPSGIHLIIEVDDEVPERANINRLSDNFDAIKAANFDGVKAPYFHYHLWVHGCDGAGGVGEYPGNDFINCDDSPLDWSLAERVHYETQGFMHELGHNLGLAHGGGDFENDKPNYLSIMNYMFGSGILNIQTGEREAQYSSFALPTLDERALNESVGISDGPYQTGWRDNNGRWRYGPGNQALDWNANGVIDAGTVVVDIDANQSCVGWGANGSLNTAPAGDDLSFDYYSPPPRIVDGPNRTCETAAAGDDSQTRPVGDVQQDTVVSYNDWEVMEFVFTDDFSYTVTAESYLYADLTHTEMFILDAAYQLSNPDEALQTVIRSLKSEPRTASLADAIQRLEAALIALDRSIPNVAATLLGIEQAQLALANTPGSTQTTDMLAGIARQVVAIDLRQHAPREDEQPFLAELKQAAAIIQEGDRIRAAGDHTAATRRYGDASWASLTGAPVSPPPTIVPPVTGFGARSDDDASVPLIALAFALACVGAALIGVGRSQRRNAR